MSRSSSRIVLAGSVCAAVLAFAASASAQIVDNFQSYTVGALPSPTWLDAGAVFPGTRVPSFPSGYVINTTDAFGNATKAVTTVGDLADSKGIYALVPISNQYNLRANARIDRYSDHPQSTTGDWAMQLSFGQNGVDNWASTPQAGIYAASLTQGWRLYVATNNFGLDLDLGVTATPGIWYTVAQDFDVAAGVFHSQIWDTASGIQLLDTFTTLSGWDPADAAFFDSFAFFGGDLSADDTIGSIGVIDDVNIVAVTTPEPGTLVLMAGAFIPLAGRLRRRRAR